MHERLLALMASWDVCSEDVLGSFWASSQTFSTSSLPWQLYLRALRPPPLCQCRPPTLDPHQFAYRSNRSTEDAVSTALHSVLSHLDKKNTYARMLFFEFSSAFNTVIPSKLITKLGDPGIHIFPLQLDFWPTDLSMSGWATTAPPPSLSTLVHDRAVCWARSSTPSSPMTACLYMDLTPSDVTMVFGLITDNDAALCCLVC